MKKGINWTSPRDLDLIKRFIKSGKIDYVEILIDNFAHINPREIKKEFGDFPINLHIMCSAFLTQKESFLKNTSKIINNWIKVIKPTYISDHLGLFHYKGRNLPLIVEANYSAPEFIIEKINNWQSKLEMKLLIENFPSYIFQESSQTEVFKKILNETNAGLLFDFSNAIVAEKNISLKSTEWIEILTKTHHFHCGGYRPIDENINNSIIIDTHDLEISKDTLNFYSLVKNDIKFENSTLTIERDANREYKNWLKDFEGFA